MAQTIVRLQTKLMREYYKDFSKYSRGKKPENKVAWITAFTPVEILEALGIAYYYPESYAAVIAASEKEQDMIQHSSEKFLSKDCCAYSCCFNGCVDTEDGPRGIPPKPDILIATNNQCNTLPNWWNTLAIKYDVPLIVIDYPGESSNREEAKRYVDEQHKNLISKLEELSGNKLDARRLDECIENSVKSVAAWNKVVSFLSIKQIEPTSLFDDINFLITARCKAETSEIYQMMATSFAEKMDAEKDSIPIFWLGYPLWYHPDRYLKEYLNGFRVVGSNYVTWWSLDYSGRDALEKLFSAYNYTFLNLMQKSRDARLKKIIENSGAKGAIVLHNKSCKCDFVSARNINIPQVELEIDMIDRTYLNVNKAQSMIDLLRETLCFA